LSVVARGFHCERPFARAVLTGGAFFMIGV
jgi:hypothetical protein